MFKIILYYSYRYEVLLSSAFNIGFLFFFLFVIGVLNIEKIHQNQYYDRTGGSYFFEQHK